MVATLVVVVVVIEVVLVVVVVVSMSMCWCDGGGYLLKRAYLIFISLCDNCYFNFLKH